MSEDESNPYNPYLSYEDLVKTLFPRRPLYDFQQEYLDTFTTESEHERERREIAKLYFERCDLYDRRVCTSISPRTGEPIPTDMIEHRLVNQHARLVIEQLAHQYGYQQDFIRRAIQQYATFYA